MGMYIQNSAIGCPYCGNYINEGRESTTLLRGGKLLVECKWVCHRCGQVARRDEKTIDKDDQ